MAKQKGQNPIEGTIGNTTFYKHPAFGWLLREKSSLDKDKIYRDPSFEYTLNNAAEFKRATLAAMQLRHAFHAALKPIKDVWLSGRMNALLLETIKSDQVSRWGERCVQNGQVSRLEGFNFCKNTKLDAVFPVGCNSELDPVTGKMNIDIPSFIPQQKLAPPGGATFFKIISVAASAGFAKELPIGYVQESGLMAIDQQMVPALHIEHAVVTSPGQFLLLTLGIVFYAIPGNIPADLISKRKRLRLGKGDAPVAYAGALMILRTAVAAAASKPSIQ